MKNQLLFLFCIFIIIQLGCQSSTEFNNKNAEKTGSEISTPTPQPQAYTLDGTPLMKIPDSPATAQKKDSLLKIAQANFDADPKNLDNIIWYGRRTAYLSHYQDAINIFSEGMKHHPSAPELYRHRGHRYISIRKYNNAIADFKKAAELTKDRDIEIEPDGLPNKLNIPLSNLQFNIYYHLGLAHYLQGDFEKAKTAYEQCMEYSVNPDLLTATTDWYYMTLRRLGDEKNANILLEKITPDMKIIENASYHNRLLMYKGLKKPEDLLDFSLLADQAGNKNTEDRINIVTQGYGVGNWFLYSGDKDKAQEIFEQVLASDYWSAFGYIAAEADMFRMKQ